jgi:hypothetical protein
MSKAINFHIQQTFGDYAYENDLNEYDLLDFKLCNCKNYWLEYLFLVSIYDKSKYLFKKKKN